MAHATGSTAWRHNKTPLRHFLQTETGSAAVLIAAALTALTSVSCANDGGSRSRCSPASAAWWFRC